jgi:hypothetical protein
MGVSKAITPIVFSSGQAVPTDALAFCLAAALTYRLDKKSRPKK